MLLITYNIPKIPNGTETKYKPYHCFRDIGEKKNQPYLFVDIMANKPYLIMATVFFYIRLEEYACIYF